MNKLAKLFLTLCVLIGLVQVPVNAEEATAEQPPIGEYAGYLASNWFSTENCVKR